MELTLRDIEQLENYWQNNLSEMEKLALEKRLETDPDFRQEADKIHLLTEGLAVVRQRQQRARFDALDATLPEIKPSDSMGWLKFLLAALVLAIAAFSVWFFMFKKEEKRFVKPKISEPIAAYFEPYPALGITMGETKNERKKDAMILYAQKEYATAIPLLNDSFKETQDSMLLFYVGIAHLAMGESAEAQGLFDKLQTNQNVPQEAVQWYLALSFVALKQYDKAMPILKNRQSDKYKDKAIKLLETIAKKE
jgi:tetratricopeptide (TPR) repeat protein